MFGIKSINLRTEGPRMEQKECSIVLMVLRGRSDLRAFQEAEGNALRKL